MAWLWDSWEEFVENVQPVLLKGRGAFGLAQRDTWAENERRLTEALQRLSDAVNALIELGFEGGFQFPTDEPENLGEVRQLLIKAIDSGERLLLLNRRLATSDAACGFLSQHDMLEHWQRYSADHRILMEVNRFVEDAGQLIYGHHEIVRSDEGFLLSDLDLPSELEADFRLARNLFSVGFEEVGMLIAGRGLEGVLRQIAKNRKLSIEAGKKREPAHEAYTANLIEALYRVRWKVKGDRLITKETRALLHFLRTIRNANAHPHGLNRSANPRETAILVAGTANRLWKETSNSRARLEPSVVKKTW